MSEFGTVITGVVGICVTIVNTMGLFILVGIRQDLRAAKSELHAEVDTAKKQFELQQEKMWKRIFRHGHEIECSNNDCRIVRLGGVVVPPDND